MTKSVYTLSYNNADDDTVVFYVGCTNDPDRRYAEHRRNSLAEDHPEYDTYKYRWIRELDRHDTRFTLTVIAENVDDDQDSEYEYVLLMARYNESLGYGFYDGSPLTNMRAGDFLSEMMRDRRVNTAQEIRQWRERRAKTQRQIEYEREQQDISRGREQRRHVANSMVIVTQQKRTEDTLKRLAQQQRQERRESELTKIREQQRAEWEQTGRILGEGEVKK